MSSQVITVDTGQDTRQSLKFSLSRVRVFSNNYLAYGTRTCLIHSLLIQFRLEGENYVGRMDSMEDE